MRSHLVRFVDDDRIPVGGGELRLEIFVAGQVVETCYQQGPLTEWIAGTRGLDHVFGKDLEGQRELLPQLILPLLDQAPRGDDEAALDIAPDYQLLAEHPRS